MRKIHGVIVGMALISLMLGACSSGSGTTASSGTSEETVGAAIGSIFNSQDQASLMMKRSIPYQLVSLMVNEAKAQNEGSPSACEMANQAPNDVNVSLSVAAGTYGVPDSAGNFVTLATTDGCAEEGLYATFTVASHEMTCTDSDDTESTVTMTDSTGVFTEGDNATEIYGTFSITAGDSTSSGINCHMTITHSEGDEGVFTAVCADEDGNTIAQATDVTCTDSE